MTMFGMSWGFRLLGITPVAKLVAMRLGDGCDPDGVGATDLEDLIEWCCASRADVIEALTLLASVEGVVWSERPDGGLAYTLPPGACPTRSDDAVRADPIATIYIIRGRLGLKVGITRSLAKRVENLRAATLDNGVTAEWSIDERLTVVRKAERLAHQILASKLIQNEWFSTTIEEAKAAIIAAIEEVKRELE